MSHEGGSGGAPTVCGAALRALSFPAEEQTGKDGRGYVSTAIKMTVESERWAQGGGGAAVAWGVGHKKIGRAHV